MNAPHLRHLFDLMASMQDRKKELNGEMDRIGQERRARFDIKAHPRTNEGFLAAFHETIDEQDSADHGAATYAGCMILILSGLLLRFRDDLCARGDDWTKPAPLFNARSLGQVVVAAANGYRHADKWAKTRHPTAQQKVSQEVLARALAGRAMRRSHAPGRCMEVLDALSGETGFDGLAANLFTFAHNVALRRRAASPP